MTKTDRARSAFRHLLTHKSAVLPGTNCRVIDKKPGPGGYVRFLFEGKMLSAHRVVYEALREPLDPGDRVGHTCENNACFNPEHLHVVYAWQIKLGPKDSGKRLTASQRLGVLTHLRAGKLTQSEIASRYGVSTQTVYNINRKRKKDRDQIVT